MKLLRMKRAYLTFIIPAGVACVCFVFSLTSFANAQETEVGTTSEESTAVVATSSEAGAGTSTEGTQTTEEETPATESGNVLLSEEQQDRITNLASNVTSLMRTTVSRLEQITGRMESRIQKLSAQGVSTEGATELTERTGTALDNAQSSLESIEILVEEAVTSEDPREDFEDVRTRFSTVGNALGQARSYLRAALATLKQEISNSAGSDN